MKRSELAQKIADSLDCTAKVWQSPDNQKVRVYLSHRGKQYGYVEVKPSGLEFSLTSYANNSYGSQIRAAAEGVEITPDETETPIPRRRTIAEIEAARQAGAEFTTEETGRVLDSRYGTGGWDDRDRIDFEG